jgi:uncharacterized protein (TIGR02171 family)
MEYYEITGKRPVSLVSPYGSGDDYPVYNVSWFDAVFFCNARSKAEGLDTVYVYSGTKALPSGTMYELTGLRYDMARNGYRLPTEAEWEYAARGGASALPYSSAGDSAYACYYAWIDKNASGKTHSVATRQPNGFGLYDMAGNVFEWTNDWKPLYNGRNITNSLGALFPGREYEKVIKGGSYNYSMMYLRPSHRSATYATMPSSVSEYVGFRCARGPMSKGQYVGITADDFTPNPVTIMASTSDLLSFIGTREAKLVFVNITGSNRTMCYVDFSQTLPYAREYLDDKSVYMPTISPDGRYVAYCSNNEGQSGPSEITIRSLDSLNTPKVKLSATRAYIPRWWVGPSTQDTFIVYTNSSVPNGNEALWRTTKTYQQKMSGGSPVGTSEEIISNGSYHDGLSKDGKYLVTGYNRLMIRNLETNEEKQSFVSPLNGKDANGSNQVCNVSISPDTGSKVRCMFLDFGYPRTSAVTDGSYGIHENLFISTMDDTVRSYMHCPSGELSWDYTEWSNQAGFAVGCGRNVAGEAHAVYAIDIVNKTSMQIMMGTELQQPDVLIGTILPNDSVGQYNEPALNLAQACLATKLLMFWRFFDSLEVVAFGSSQAQWGFDPAMMRPFKGINMATRGGDFLGRDKIIVNYVLKHCPKIAVICSGLDIGWLNLIDGNMYWQSGVGQSKGYSYDSCHAFWPEGVSQNFKDLIMRVPLPYPSDTENRGFLDVPSAGWGPVPPPCVSPVAWTISDSNYQKNMAAIYAMADILRSRRVHWIMINFPVSPNYRNTEWYSKAGPSWQTADDILLQLRNIEKSNSYFHLYDVYLGGNNDYTYEDFWDEYHLCGRGAEKLSGRVKALIDSLLRK